MPLSEHEERILAEIERQLSAEDPRFVQRARKAGRRDGTRTVRFAVAGFVVGFAMLLLLTFHAAFGFIGFGLMLASLVIGLRAWDRSRTGERVGVISDRLRRTFERPDDEDAS